MKNFIGLIILFTIFSCNNGPKEIEVVHSESSESKEAVSGVFGGETSAAGDQGGSSFTDEVHTVRVLEALPTERYVYMHVTEGPDSFWIATNKQEIRVGDTYFYRGGLTKTNFESREYNRVFDKLVLVSNIVPADHSRNAGTSDIAEVRTATEDVSTQDIGSLRDENSIPIKKLVDNADQYNGQEVQFTGKVVKVNPNIMGRNWLHIKDGTMDDYDFVATTTTPVMENQIVTMIGELVVDRDYGAGYRYDVIIENGRIIK